MSTYKYRAKKGPENIVEGVIEALSEKSAVEKLSQAGYLPLHVELETQDKGILHKGAGAKHAARPAAGKRVKSSEITVVSRELASLLKSGVPILKALDIISEQSENARLKETFTSIHGAIKDGSAFSSALLKHPRIFNSLYIALIRSGENSGALPETLLRIAEYRANQEQMISRFWMAIAYPVFMAITGFATVIFMLTFVMPKISVLFTNAGQTLPLPTRILISTSAYMRHWGLWIAAAASIAIFLMQRRLKTAQGKLFLSSFVLGLPLFGKLILKTELSRFSRTLELLIKNGITILKAIETAVPVLGNEIIKNQLLLSRKELEQGGSFGRSLKGSKLFPAFMANLIVVGEESGRITESLSEIANAYERDTDEQMKVMTSLLEPLMILLIGLIVGFIVVAMLLPVFDISAAAG